MEGWSIGRTAFHRAEVNATIIQNEKVWLGTDSKLRVLVPLCGEAAITETKWKVKCSICVLDDIRTLDAIGLIVCNLRVLPLKLLTIKINLNNIPMTCPIYMFT
jgi:hypothetical protein